MRLDGSVIASNQALHGGGIYSEKVDVNLISGSIDHNIAKKAGGGIYNEGGSVSGLRELVHNNRPNNIFPLKS